MRWYLLLAQEGGAEIFCGMVAFSEIGATAKVLKWSPWQ